MSKLLLKENLSLLVLILIAGITVGAALTSFYSFSNHCNVASVGCKVYWDSAMTDLVTSIDWGTIRPTQSIVVQIYVVNTGSVPGTSNMATQNWDPIDITQHVTVDWNLSAFTILEPNVPVLVDVTMTMGDSFTGSSISGLTEFNFEMIIFVTE